MAKEKENSIDEQVSGATSEETAQQPARIQSPVILTASTREELAQKAKEFKSNHAGAIAGVVVKDYVTGEFSIRIDINN